MQQSVKTKRTTRGGPGDSTPVAERGAPPATPLFWDFSLSVYARPGVAPACLAMQDRHGADVNFLLYCCWLGATGRGVLGGEDLDAALASSRNWQEEVVLPLRRIRTFLKGANGPAADLSQKMVELEIEAERVEQQTLQRTTRRQPDPNRADKARVFDAAENLRRYLVTLGVAVGGIERKDAAVILKAAFPTVTPAEIDECCALTLCGGR